MSPDGTNRSTRTVNRTRTVLRLFFGYLADRGTIRHSPARLLRNGRTDRPIPTVLSKAEEKRLLAVLDAGATTSVGRRDRVLFTLLLRSGMRLSAALALDVEDLDLAQGVAVSRSGKHGRIQEVFLPRVVVRLLKRHLKNQGRGTTGAVFPSSRERRLSARQAQYRFGALLVAAGLERPVTVHALRHTFATRLRERTGDLRIVQAALGHRQLGTTEVYAAIGAADLRHAVTG